MPPQNSAENKGVSVLIIDDQPNLIAKQLAAQPSVYTVLKAGNQTEAIDYAWEYIPDLLLVDLNLEDENGWYVLLALIDEISSGGTVLSLPMIVLLSADPSLSKAYFDQAIAKRSEKNSTITSLDYPTVLKKYDITIADKSGFMYRELPQILRKLQNRTIEQLPDYAYVDATAIHELSAVLYTWKGHVTPAAIRDSMNEHQPLLERASIVVHDITELALGTNAMSFPAHKPLPNLEHVIVIIKSHEFDRYAELLYEPLLRANKESNIQTSLHLVTDLPEATELLKNLNAN
jgi:CheY-like chemotaxis protein